MKMHLTLCCLLSIWVCFADHEHAAVLDQVETNAVENPLLFQLNDELYQIRGICYHPVPKGSSERDFGMLSKDISLMQEAGINTVRVYAPIEERDVLDELLEAGIKVIIGFGYNQNGYYDMLTYSFIDYIKAFRDHEAILMWEFGNEYNYHPEWFGGDLAVWYEALNDAAAIAHALDPTRAVTTAHGDLPDKQARESCPNVDVWGMNVYRWDDPTPLIEQWASVSDKPMYLSEAGADSYMSKSTATYSKGENQGAQALANHRILEAVFNQKNLCSGVTLFSFTDGWWKAGRNRYQDPGGFAPNSGGVPYDGAANEEYWGILTLDRKKKKTFEVVKRAYIEAALVEECSSASPEIH